MCTAISLVTGDHYFGRNLDYEHGFGEKVTVTPRNYRFSFTHQPSIEHHFAMIGMALPSDGYPLYFDAVNERGLCMAGLNFPHYARYNLPMRGKTNVAVFELIPWVLSQCADTDAARELLRNVNLTTDAFSPEMPPTPLHFIISDSRASLTLEQTERGLCICENPAKVLTNSPDFEYHMTNLASYIGVSREEPTNKFSDKISLEPYSRGMGGIGLPGDLSSASRFVRAAFAVLNSECNADEAASVNQFFHVLATVSQTRGCVRVGDGFEITRYSSCCNASRGVYYYTTYENSRVCAVDMHREDLASREITVYDLCDDADFFWQN